MEITKFSFLKTPNLQKMKLIQNNNENSIKENNNILIACLKHKNHYNKIGNCKKEKTTTYKFLFFS